MQACELFEAGADLVVEGLQSLGVVTGGHHPYGEDHLAEAGAAPEKLQSDLRIRALPQRMENPQSLGHSSLRVLVAVLR